MRVKLTYTVDEEEVLSEVASLLSHSTPIINGCVANFNELGELLSIEGKFNIHRFHEKVDAFRRALSKLDSRVYEITEIVNGYEEHKRGIQPQEPNTVEVPPQEEPQAPDEESGRSVNSFAYSRGIKPGEISRVPSDVKEEGID